MKRAVRYAVFLAMMTGMLVSCEKSKKDDNIVPEDFKVGMSDAISRPDLDKKDLTQEVDGNTLYNYLRTLVWIGEVSADMVNEAITSVRELKIEGPMEFSFTSTHDGRLKDVSVVAGAYFGNDQWEYGLYMYDEDGSRALQLFWNTNPLKGVALMIPGNFNRNIQVHARSVLKIEYGEEGLTIVGSDKSFEKYMIVSVVNLDATDTDYASKIKLFAGKVGDVVYIRGNTIHPTATLIDETRTGGLCWTFVAKNDVGKDIAVARVALPPVDLYDLTNLWTDYSLKNVLTAEVEKAYSDLSAEELNQVVTAVTANADDPAYFSGTTGFVSSGTSVPSQEGFTSDFIDISGLVPFVPAVVNGMEFDLAVEDNR